MPRITVVLCLVLIACVCGSAQARKLIQLTVLHRHGARTGPTVDGDNLSWAHCILSETGVKMGHSLGRFINRTWGWFLPDRLNRQQIKAVSTDFERTIRTAIAVFRGLYDGRFEIPYVEHQSNNDDFLLGYFYSWPSAVLATPYLNTYNGNTSAQTLKIIDNSTLLKLGRAMNVSTKICPGEPTTCALLAEDIGTCELSNGGIPPALREELPKLKDVQSQSFAFQYMHSTTNRYFRNIGSYGYLLAKQMHENFEAALNNKTDILYHHYSGHDITIYGLLVTLGTNNATSTNHSLIVPTFASAVFMELYDDGNVAISFAQCDQEHGSDYAYQHSKIHMACQGPDLVTYYASECPVADYKRFIDTMAPQSPLGVCYRDPRDVEITGCGNPAAPNVSAGPTSPPAYCLKYRQLCPEVACGADRILDRQTFACIPAVSPPAKIRRAFVYTLVAIACAVVGGAMGILAFRRMNAPKEGLLLADD